jgi:hypothetical protein
MSTKARQNVKLAFETTSGNPVTDPEPAVTIPQKPQSIAPVVKTSEIAIATQSASRVPEIITATAQNINVQVPASTRLSSPGKRSEKTFGRVFSFSLINSQMHSDQLQRRECSQ